MQRICKKCKVEKSIECFSKSKNCRLGRRYSCKECWNKKYVKKGPCTNNLGWFKEGHKYIPGGEKGWFKKGERPSVETEFKKGKKSHNYIDGKSNSRYSPLNSRLLQNIRKNVLERDGNKCRKCNMKECILHVHHIIPIRVNEKLIYEEENLITLCPKCHVKEELEFRKKEVESLGTKV